MEKKLEEILSAAAKRMDEPLHDSQLLLFAEYYRELLFWNEKINLVSARSPLDIPVKHFIDSLTPLPFIPKEPLRLLDIGTGAGFPGIPLKIARSALKVSLLESSRKKVSFLKHIIRTLALDDTEVIHERVEHIMEDDRYTHSFDVVISRATFKLPEFLRIGSAFLVDHGTIISMKGKNVELAPADTATASDRWGVSLVSSHEIHLPVTGDVRKIMIFKKVF